MKTQIRDVYGEKVLFDGVQNNGTVLERQQNEWWKLLI
jgi:hypothetical protein